MQVGIACGIKPLARIAHNDEDAALLVASHQALDDFVGIFLRAVNDCIGQRFLQRQFDRVLFAVHALDLVDRFHDLLHDWIHGLAIRRQRDADTQSQLIWIEVVLGEMFLRRHRGIHNGFVYPCPRLNQ